MRKEANLFTVAGQGPGVPVEVPRVPAQADQFLLWAAALNTGRIRFARTREEVLGVQTGATIFRDLPPSRVIASDTGGWMVSDVAGDGLVFATEVSLLEGRGNLSEPIQIPRLR